MKDQLRSRYQKLQVLLYVFACIILFSVPSIAQTVDCHSTLPWTNYNVYVQGNKAKSNGVQYEAKWWTQNQAPSNDPNGPWLVLGTCSDNTTVQDNCSALANWSTATVYTGGELVVYSGNIFKARNYTQGQTPGSVSTPWDLHGMCDPNTLPGGTVITTTPWNLEGNSNATATSFIGTTNNFPLLFKANNVEAMRIATTGAVGVNVPATNGPNNNIYYHKFTVNGPTNLVGNENVLSISSPTLSANGTKHYMYFSNLTFPNSTEQYSNIGAYEFLDPNGTIQNGKHLILQAAEASKLGIGFFNAAPTEKLSVNGNGLFTGTLKATSISLTSGAGLGKVLTSDAAGLATWQTVDLNAGWSLAGNSIQGTDGTSFIGTTNAKDLILKSNNVVGIRLRSDGNIAIGSSTSAYNAKLSVSGNTYINGKLSIGDEPYFNTDYLLSVKGKILAERVVVLLQSTWPDYAFAKDYKLMPLLQVEQFVNQYKHLPGIPSEKEVKANGIELGDMNVMLLEKIEELTLHAIDHEKTIKSQNDLINDQKKLIEKLFLIVEEQEKRVENLESKE